MFWMIDSIAYYIIKVLAFFIQLLPIRFSLAGARLLGHITYFLRIRHAQTYANIKIAFGNQLTPKQIKRIIHANHVNFAQNCIEIFYFPKMNKEYSDRQVVEVRREIYDRCIQDRTKGVVFLTAHFGNWELLSQWGCFQGHPIFVVVRDQKLKRLDSFLTDLREFHGSTMARKGVGIKVVLKALNNNGLLGILGDQSGGKQGVPVTFFGRRTSAPQGVVDLAYRTGAVLQPSFLVREQGPNHSIHFEEPISIEKTENMESDIQLTTQKYIDILEKYIREFPEQWLWFFKRWKYSWTKKIVVLSDGKVGHESQSMAVSNLMERLDDLDGDYHFSSEVVQIQFKNNWKKMLFPYFSFLMMPFAQGRLGWLKHWIEKDSFEQLMKVNPDFIVSTGSSVLPINLMLKKEFRCKNIVIMKPSFPFSLFRNDLNLVPDHDRVKESKYVVSTRVAPNLVDAEGVKVKGEELRAELNLDHHQVVSLFLGGKTKKYDFNFMQFKKLLDQLEGFAKRTSCKLLITTSRRTQPKFEEELKRRFKNHPHVPLLIIANEHNPNGAILKMMGAANVVLVSEDSVSMISEGVSSGKDVIILKLNKRGLASKHYRFENNLKNQGVLQIATPDGIRHVLDTEMNHRRTRLIYDDNKKMSERLRSLV